MSWQVIVSIGSVGLIVVAGLVWSFFQWARGIGEKTGRAVAFQSLEGREARVEKKRQAAGKVRLTRAIDRIHAKRADNLGRPPPTSEQARRELLEAKAAWDSDDS